MRKILQITATLLLVAYGSTANAKTATVDGYTYEYEVENDIVYIESISPQPTGAFAFPANLGGYPVTRINNYLFEENSGLTSVIIPSGVTTIGYNAFYGCVNLSSVTIPSSVTIIGDEAFHKTALWNNLANNAIFYVDGWACGYKGTPPSGQLVLPNGTRGIAYDVFSGCDGLTSVTIPSSVVSIGGGAFSFCGLTSVTIPQGVTHIGNYAFYGCSGLTSVTIPSSVTSIEDGAFGDTALWNNLANNTIFYVDGWVCGYKGTRPSGQLVLPNGTKGIVDYAFSDCAGLTSVTIPSGVTYIGYRAFDGCRGLTSMSIPSSVTYIGGEAFSGCSGLTSVTIPPNVTHIGSYAFASCSGLTSITIPSSVTSIKCATFDNCTSLTSVTIPQGVTYIGDWAFSCCTALTSVTIPQGVTYIGDYAFSDCSLTSVTIPQGVTSIGKRAFVGCTLTSVTIPSSVTYIGDCAFADCNLASVTVLANLMEIGEYAFGGDSILQEVYFWGNAPQLVSDWLYDYTSETLTTYVLPDSTGWNGPGSTTLPDLWPLSGARRNIAYMDPNLLLVAFNANGGTPETQPMVQTHGTPYILPATNPTRAGYTFMGWFTAANGGTQVTSATTVDKNGSLTVYAQWQETNTYLSDPAATAAVMTTTTYAGFAYDEDGTMCGTMTLSAKATVRASKGVTTTNWAFTAKAVLQNATVSFSAKAWDNNEPGNLRIETRNKELLDVRVEGDRFWGEISGGKVGATLTVDGARDVFANRKDLEAQERLTPLKGYYTTALLLNETQEPAGYLTLTIGNLGAVKYAGKMKDGTSVSGSVKLLEGLNEDGWYAVGIHKPLYSKKGFMGGLLWLDPTDQVLRVDADEGWFVDWVCADPKKTPVNEKLNVCGGYFGDGKTGSTLASSYGFSMTMPENLPAPAATLVSGEWMVEALPLDLTATVTGVKFVFPKAATPKKDKATGLYDYALENPSGLKLTYTARTGLFKGSFKMYYDGLTNRDVLQHKTVTVSYTGVLTPVRDGAFAELSVGLGTGTATINRKKEGMPVYLWQK